MSGMPAIVKCPCGEWHRHFVFTTETYVHHFDCGLTVTLEKGGIQYARHGKPVKVERLSAHPDNLDIRLEGYMPLRNTP